MSNSRIQLCDGNRGSNTSLAPFRLQLPAAPRVRIEGGRKAEHAIVQVAKEEHAMLVVVGCRGRGGLARAILGSTSDYVVHHAHCPVIVARV